MMTEQEKKGLLHREIAIIDYRQGLIQRQIIRAYIFIQIQHNPKDLGRGRDETY